MKTPPPLRMLITGATDGVGRLVAKRLAAAGAGVVVHGRNHDKGRGVVEDIQHETGNSQVEFRGADFESLDEVRRLAREITNAHERIDLLINNAGIGFGRPGAGPEISRDGHESRFAVNYLAPFLLTHLLLPAIRQSLAAVTVPVIDRGSPGWSTGHNRVRHGALRRWSGPRVASAVGWNATSTARMLR